MPTSKGSKKINIGSFFDLRNVLSSFFRQKGLTMNLSLPIHRAIFNRNTRDAKTLLSMGTVKEVVEKIQEVSHWAVSRSLDWSLGTVVKRWLEKNTVKKKPYYLWGNEKLPAVNRNGQWYVQRNGEWQELNTKYVSERDIVWD